VNAHKTSGLRPVETPPTVVAALRRQATGREVDEFTAIFTMRTTAQFLDNVITGWMADSASSPARFQILTLLWAADGKGVAQKEIVAALHVSKPTVSSLVTALERDGLVTSEAAAEDRRNQMARLTRRGRETVEKALASNRARLRAAFRDFTVEEIATLTSLMQRLRAGFAA
jgi:DNA-binding MarR family transcriptional regulator